MVCIVLIVCIGFWKTLDSLDCLYCFLDWVGLFGLLVLFILCGLFLGLLDSLDCVLLLGFVWTVWNVRIVFYCLDGFCDAWAFLFLNTVSWLCLNR